ncbi:EsaB/YukD family protein [Vallicoccus soli]|nr:EsaB/YukD family protein [Vallicoccus soli]
MSATSNLASPGGRDDLRESGTAVRQGPDEPQAEGPGDGAWRRVRVVGPTGALDVSLPTGRPVAELVDELRTALLPGAPLGDADRPWHLHRVGGAPLPPGAPLVDARLRDGDVLHLTPGAAPAPAHRVDDALEVLAQGASAAGRWTLAGLRAAAAVAAVVLGAGAAVLALGLPGGGPAAPLVVAALLLLAATRLRATRDGDLGSDVAALAALPAWAAAGWSVGGTAGGGWARAALVGLGVAAGALAAAACTPRRRAWWSLGALGGAAVAVGAGLVARDVLAPAEAAGAVGAVALAGLAALPWLVTRTALWSEPAPAGRDEASLLRAAAGTRALLTGATAACAGAVGACATALALGEGSYERWLGAALAVVLLLRARRSRVVADSAAALVSAAVPLAVALARLALDGGTTARAVVLGVLAVLTAASLLLHALGAVAATGRRTALERMARPRVRRSLDVLEGLAAVTVLPLLAGVLGVYGAAADAGSQL